MNIVRAGILWNPTKGDGLSVARELSKALKQRGVEVIADNDLSAILGCQAIFAPETPNCDVLFVLGGDGTLLSALDYSVPRRVPMIGINLGRLGFLTELERGNISEGLTKLFSGEYFIEERMLMTIRGGDGGVFAMNDIVVTRRSAEIGVLSIETEIRGAVIDRVSGDGLIIATATGSTAYSLSAGGPIVAPGLDCFVITPVCPHTMNARPVVASANEEITVRVLDKPNDATVVFDGRRAIQFRDSDPAITIVRSTESARFIRFSERNYFDLLRNKLSEWTH